MATNASVYRFVMDFLVFVDLIGLYNLKCIYNRIYYKNRTEQGNDPSQECRIYIKNVILPIKDLLFNKTNFFFRFYDN